VQRIAVQHVVSGTSEPVFAATARQIIFHLLKASSLSRLEEHMPLAARQRPLLADIVEKVGARNFSKPLVR
jgi:hypothetical protein